MTYALCGVLLAFCDLPAHNMHFLLAVFLQQMMYSKQQKGLYHVRDSEYKLRRKLLTFSFTHPNKDYYVRELSSLIDEDRVISQGNCEDLKKKGFLRQLPEGERSSIPSIKSIRCSRRSRRSSPLLDGRGEKKNQVWTG